MRTLCWEETQGSHVEKSHEEEGEAVEGRRGERREACPFSPTYSSRPSPSSRWRVKRASWTFQPGRCVTQRNQGNEPNQKPIPRPQSGHPSQAQPLEPPHLRPQPPCSIDQLSQLPHVSIPDLQNHEHDKATVILRH